MLPPEEKPGASRELIGAAVSACRVGWLIAGVKTYKIPIEDLTAVTDTKIGTDRKDRTVIESCTTKLNVKVKKEGRDEKELERVKKIVERFMTTGCLITRSVQRGFKFNYECNWLQEEN
jgi:organic hydroperoxide reductase OsmC/OhrA